MNIYKITNIETGLSYIGKDQRDCEYYMGKNTNSDQISND